MTKQADALQSRITELEGALERIRARINAQFTLPSVQPVSAEEILNVIEGVMKTDESERTDG